MRTIIVHHVESSAIDAVAYDDEHRELYVRYHGGGCYTYADVPPDTWDALLAAESKGAFVNRTIKPRYEAREGGPI